MLACRAVSAHSTTDRMPSNKPRSATERSRARYWREKLGLKPVQLDLPPDDLARAMVASGYLLRDQAHDFAAVRRAASTMMRGLITHILVARRAVQSLPSGARPPTSMVEMRESNGKISHVDTAEGAGTDER